MPTVLVADDSPTQLAMLRRPLQDEGYIVLTAETGEEAFAMARSHQPQVIFMDVIMPCMNGFQATRRISRDALTAHIPIVLLTSKDQTSDKVWGLRQGAVAYLVKPVEEPVLLNIASRLAGARRSDPEG